MWLGNLLGAWLTGMAVRSTRYLTAEIVEKATKICQAKLNDNLLSIFILAVLCNMLIYIAVDGFNRNPHDLGKYLSVFFGVMVFIICGFEHCVANMYYFSVADMWSWKTLLYVIVMTLGNSVGGVIFPF
jgi:formate/nitrite transporter FocA (FNT family)